LVLLAEPQLQRDALARFSLGPPRWSGTRQPLSRDMFAPC